MKNLFSHSNGRLRTGRISFLLFLILLVAFSLVFTTGKQADKVLVKVEHMFEPSVKPSVKEVPTPSPKDQVRKPAQKQAQKKLEKVQKKAPEQTEPKKESVAKTPSTATPVKTEPAISKKAAEKPTPKPVKKVEIAKKTPPPAVKNTEPLKVQTFEKVVPKPDLKIEPEKKQKVDFKPELAKLPKKQDPGVVTKKTTTPDLRFWEKPVAPAKEPEKLTLPSKSYFEMYRQWQAQGESSDDKNGPVALRIENLENAYELFQMKVVALKDKVPHTDLNDQSRVAHPSLSQFSSTCFVVSDPWGKWGDALSDSGFRHSDDIQVRYYTYEFVKNAIYTRATQAFKWSLVKAGLPQTTDPAKADVLGKVFSINKEGGGSFGVFVPVLVDLPGSKTIMVDPLACFAGQPDILALHNAGLL